MPTQRQLAIVFWELELLKRNVQVSHGNSLKKIFGGNLKIFTCFKGLKVIFLVYKISNQSRLFFCLKILKKKNIQYLKKINFAILRENLGKCEKSMHCAKKSTISKLSTRLGYRPHHFFQEWQGRIDELGSTQKCRKKIWYFFLRDTFAKKSYRIKYSVWRYKSRVVTMEQNLSNFGEYTLK